MIDAGYTASEIEKIKAEVKDFENLRKEIQIASGDYIDLKQYEPAMRHLIDSYLGAEESRVLSKFDDLSLVELIVEKLGFSMKDTTTMNVIQVYDKYGIDIEEFKVLKF